MQQDDVAAAVIDYTAFRAEVQAFADTCPEWIRTSVRRNAKLTRREWSAWQRLLYERGWAAPGWPRNRGGTGWNLQQRFIFEEVMARSDCPVQYHHGLGHIGPVLMAFGTPEQQARLLPRILSGEDWWCQGYSEPGSGSDLASLKTRAVRQGDHYVVSGQKTWTSHAHEADLMYALVRTSTEARKQDGISMLLIPLSTAGVSVRPIRTIDGWHHLNEVFFDEARVPVTNLVGEEGKGWRCAKFLLERERTPTGGVPRLIRLWQRVAELVEAEIARGTQDRELDTLRTRLLVAEAELKGAREMLARAIDDVIHGRPLGSKPSALKLLTGELGQRIMGIAYDAIGPTAAWRFAPTDGEGAPAEPAAVDPADIDNEARATWVHNYLYFRSRTLAGGTSEVQRNVIARELFGS